MTTLRLASCNNNSSSLLWSKYDHTPAEQDGYGHKNSRLQNSILQTNELTPKWGLHLVFVTQWISLYIHVSNGWGLPKQSPLTLTGSNTVQTFAYLLNFHSTVIPLFCMSFGKLFGIESVTGSFVSPESAFLLGWFILVLCRSLQDLQRLLRQPHQGPKGPGQR